MSRVIERRVFHAKIGRAEEVVGQLRELQRLFRQHGLDVRQRVMTDYRSGRTDRVSWEVEGRSIADVETMLDSLITNAQFQAETSPVLNRLNELVEYAEVDHWLLR